MQQAEVPNTTLVVEQQIPITQKHVQIESPQKKKQNPTLPDKIINQCTRQLNDFYCDFYLMQSQTIKIVLTSQIDAITYELALTKESKKQHEELNFFESNEEIFQYLIENTQEIGQNQKERLINIEENGRISMRVISTIGKKQRQKTIFLQPLKDNTNREAYLQKVVKRIGKNCLQMRKQLQILNHKFQQLQKQNKQLAAIAQRLGTRLKFTPDRTQKNFTSFKEDDRKITKIIDNTSYSSIISDNPIPKNRITYFQTKINNTANKNIMIGIGSKFIKGINNVYSHSDFIGLYLYGQCYIWQKQNQRDLYLKSIQITKGAVISTVINHQHGYIYWQFQGIRIGSASIPTQLKAKLLYPVVLLININDEIIINP